MRRTGLIIVAMTFGLLTGLVAAEAGIRVFSLAPPLRKVFGGFISDPYLPFKPKPLTHEVGETAEFTYDYKHNSAGFRDIEHDTAKTTGVFRILGLGDSFTYGVGAAFEQTYLYRLEEKLKNRREDHPGIEVIKAGVPRYFPLPERILLERYGLSYHPDLVIVGVLPNDVVDTFLGIDAVRLDATGYLRTRESNELGELGTMIYRHSHLGRLLLRIYIDRKLRPHQHELFRNGGFHEKDWLSMEQEYGRMADLADSVGAKLVLVHIPQKGPWNKDAEYLPQRLGAWAAKRGVYFVDILPAMQQSAAPEQLYYPSDGHCTPAGYAVIAEALYHALIDKQLVP